MPDIIAAWSRGLRERGPVAAPQLAGRNAWSVHSISRERIVLDAAGSHEQTTTDIVIVSAPWAHERVSIVSRPETLDADIDWLASVVAIKPEQTHTDPLSLPVAWVGGTASVLLHEALGHPSEHGARRVAWPAWLRVIDDPAEARGFAGGRLDDSGGSVERRVLSDGERPSSLRRWSFRDMPLRRMTNLIVTARAGAATALPDPRIEITLVGQGHWDSLTDTISIDIAVADLVRGEERRRIPPFRYRRSRRAVAASIDGFFGDLTPYRGVICSDEGQQLPVGSLAVGVLTRPE